MIEKKIETKIEVHICQFGKECPKHGAEELADRLKKWAKEEHKGEIKVVRSGCLGQCENAIAIALYPEHTFLLQATKDDFQEIKEGLTEALQKY
jgi:NADH:ubiquinone oxidoreductase subunit E